MSLAWCGVGSVLEICAMDLRWIRLSCEKNYDMLVAM